MRNVRLRKSLVVAVLALATLASPAAAETACPDHAGQRLMSAMVTHGIDPAIGMASLPVHGVDPVLSQGNAGVLYPLSAGGGPFWLYCFYAKKRHHTPDTSASVALPPGAAMCRRDVARKLVCGPG